MDVRNFVAMFSSVVVAFFFVSLDEEPEPPFQVQELRSSSIGGSWTI
jgi:hypothetical protein